MKSFLKFLLVLGLAWQTVAATKNKVDVGENRPYFILLCRLYTTALNPPLPHQVHSEVAAILAQIRLISTAFAEGEWAEIITKSQKPEDLPESAKKMYPGVPEDLSKWKEAAQDLEKSKEYKRFNTSTTSQDSMKARIKKIVQEAVRIERKLWGPLEKNTYEGVSKKFSAAIYGGGETAESAIKQAVLDTNLKRTSNCGPTSLSGKGRGAGKNLLLDMMCLCASYDGGTNKAEACGTKVGGTATHWTDAAPSGDDRGALFKVWQALEPSCNKTAAPPATTVGEVRNLLAEFLQAVDRGGVGKAASDGQECPQMGLLGTYLHGSDCSAVPSSGCTGDGSQANHGVCVYYGKEAPEKSVEWYRKYDQAVTGLSELLNQTRDFSSELSLLKMLQVRAEDLYEETKGTSELEPANLDASTKSNSQKQNPSTYGTKTTSQDPEAKNAAATPRLILPWALLI